MMPSDPLSNSPPRGERTVASSPSSPPGGGGTAGLPLEGVRVLDLGWVISGPLSARFLAVMGAEVIKVGTARRREFQAQTYNQSKLSCALNISKPQGVELARGLLAISDVAIENMAAGTIDRLGLGYEANIEVRPDLIMVASAGLGHSGPDKDLVAYGSLLQHYTGWNAFTGGGGIAADPWVAMELAMVTVAALNHRAVNGEGQYVDFSMAEALVGTMPEAILDYQMNDGRVREPTGNGDERYTPHGAYHCKGEDRWVAIAVTDNDEWRALCRVIGRDDLATDSDLAQADGRRCRQAELDRAITAWTQQREDYEAMALLQDAGVPAGPSLDAERSFQDPQLLEGGYFTPYENAEGEAMYHPGVPWRSDDGQQPVLEAAPVLGQHNEYVYSELLGMSEAEITRLVEQQVIY